MLHQRSESAGTPGKSSTPKKVAQIGERVTDSHLTFDVSNVTCDVRRIGIAPYFVTAAKGHQWCIVSMTVTAAGEEEIQYSDAFQDAYLRSGARVTVDVGASYFLYQANNGRLVAPKSPVHVRIPFEVPDGQRITMLVLHDSAFSAGATVRV